MAIKFISVALAYVFMMLVAFFIMSLNSKKDE